MSGSVHASEAPELRKPRHQPSDKIASGNHDAAGPARAVGASRTDRNDATVEATFAFVDLAGFTALTETHGDAEAVATVRSFQERVRQVLQPGDELVKMIGDAVMLKFCSPLRAVISLSELVHNEMSRVGCVLLPRTGAHHGTAVALDGDYYGAAVNLAARVAGEASAGQLLVTQQIAEAATDIGATITHVGYRSLRNVTRPVDIFDIRVCDAPTAVDPVCHMRVPADDNSPVLSWRGREVRFCGLPCRSLCDQARAVCDRCLRFWVPLFEFVDPRPALVDENHKLLGSPRRGDV